MGNFAKNLINNSTFGWGVFPVEARVINLAMDTIMKREVKFAEAIGKRLENVAFSNEQVVLVFDDNTFSTIGLDKGYDNDVDLIEEPLELLSFSREKLLRVGIVSEDELKKLIADKDEKCREFYQKRELAEYERLKKKLGL